jgi:5-methylcytosine-specific restriction endonuclease McrA
MKIDRQKVYEKYDGLCAYCGQRISIKNMQVDHMIPKSAVYYQLSKNPNANLVIDSFENLMPSCKRCNHYKRADDLEGFRKKMETIHERIASEYIVKVAQDYGIIKILPFNGKFLFERY